MRLSIDLGRWTTTKAALAVAGALAIAGAVGSSLATSPIITPPIKWQGGAEFHNVTSGSRTFLYQVPAGRNFMLTDLMVGNLGDTAASFSLLQASDGFCSDPSRARVNLMPVPPGEAAFLNLQTGIGFAAGQVVCINAPISVTVSGRGFLFTAAPAS